MRDRRMAVVGMALRFPGADTPDAYWRDIVAGVTHVRRFTDAEFAAAGVPEETYRDPEFTGASALLPGIDGFDAAFFGMSGREATVTDPQQRLFLEVCEQALEDGGYAGTDARVGVYASVGYRLYSLHSYLAHNIGAAAGGDDWTAVKQIQVGNYPDFTANRAAFRLGLDGPAVNVATACSSALVSVHLAGQALLAGDADLMVVGSAALHLPQITGHRHVKGSTISPTGAVRAFDAAADGTVGGNGAAAVLLKPLERALADGDTVHAVILGSAVTNDGADKAGFAAPGVAGQRDAVLTALESAGVPAESIGYVEAHGTGTYKGDPIEFAALTEAFRRHTDRTGFCALGSTKPAIGHLDSAAGLAGLIKAILVLRHGTLPPLVNFTRPNPRLGVSGSPFVLPRRAAPWPADPAGPRRAGVHSIGMGGTNAHVILEQAPPAPARKPSALPASKPSAAPALLPVSTRSPEASALLPVSTRSPEASALLPVSTRSPEASALLPVSTRSPEASALLPLSARSPEALAQYARSFRDALDRDPGLAPADLLTTTALGRRHLDHRLVVTASGTRGLAAGLDAFLAGRPDPAAYRTGVVTSTAAPVFLFSGQGGTAPGIAAALARRFPLVAETLDACARIHRQETEERDFTARLVDGTGPAVWDTAFAQPALFALQVAQARLWRRFRVRPVAVAGHSVGEYAALCAAGALSLEDGMRLLCRRGRLMRDTEPGAMLAVFAPYERVRALLDAVGAGLELAVSNGPEHHVVAGRPGAVAAARSHLADVPCEPLPVDRAFHTALLDPILDELRAVAGKTELRPVETEFVSGLDGTVRPPGWRPDADYLVRQARQTADFHAVLRALASRDVLVELGPGAPFTGMARRVLPDVPCLPTQGRAPGADGLWSAVAGLHCAGVPVDWAALLDGQAGHRIPLPTYPFQHRSYWTGPAPAPDPSKEDSVAAVTAQERSVLDRVRELTARHLGFAPDEVTPARTYVGLGADSLQLIGMLRQLEAEFDVRIAIREILEEAGTPELTARLIEERRAHPAPAPEAQVITPTKPPASPAPDGYATRAEIAELTRQINLLAETQSAMLTQLSEAVALLGADRTAR
ncbi:MULTISPECIES: type I polyketide synthase [Streptomyces]|uniref:6-deoxyerythronolide-B synthase n=1 Tax=Streptomyces dengpaensis TaxID=2049881 RepID=A0ABM6SN41_9ACTN|nr:MULTISPECIES: type I polyketide synthase [Streptomyces]AVH56071.1 6-deoxyerythronolide-B synthase [Streptomyces dengpaensis]PIB06329.1 6-deoxyerythronolide-B synthase [Streptomyces sp. HG99]